MLVDKIPQKASLTHLRSKIANIRFKISIEPSTSSIFSDLIYGKFFDILSELKNILKEPTEEAIIKKINQAVKHPCLCFLIITIRRFQGSNATSSLLI